jgi:hypothetical protein
VQTVPTSANLYPTAFTYHTVSGVPPDFNNCNTFLGAPILAALPVMCIFTSSSAPNHFAWVSVPTFSRCQCHVDSACHKASILARMMGCCANCFVLGGFHLCRQRASGGSQDPCSLHDWRLQVMSHTEYCDPHARFPTDTAVIRQLYGSAGSCGYFTNC